MKQLFIIVFFIFTINVSYSQATWYETSQDTKHPEFKVLKGIINKYLLQNDTAFKWYGTNYKYYNGDTATTSAFERNRGKISYVVFGGTWCDDTQYILPQFYHLLDKAGVPDSAVSLYGVTRDKKTLGNIAAAFNITNVPTFIVMQDGKEIGRVLEYGKTGKWDRELAALLPK